MGTRIMHCCALGVFGEQGLSLWSSLIHDDDSILQPGQLYGFVGLTDTAVVLNSFYPWNMMYPSLKVSINSYIMGRDSHPAVTKSAHYEWLNMMGVIRSHLEAHAMSRTLG